MILHEYALHRGRSLRVLAERVVNIGHIKLFRPRVVARRSKSIMQAMLSDQPSGGRVIARVNSTGTTDFAPLI